MRRMNMRHQQLTTFDHVQTDAKYVVRLEQDTAWLFMSLSRSSARMVSLCEPANVISYTFTLVCRWSLCFSIIPCEYTTLRC